MTPGGAFRLSAPAGSRIDRSRPLRFTFEGATLDAFDGDTVTSALAANGIWLIARSFKYHRPRGPLTVAGRDGNALVQLPGAPNVPADTCRISDGLAVHGQHYEGSLRRDRFARQASLARFLPVGFYYRAFFRPGWRTWQRVWEPLFRRRAGLGAVDIRGSVHSVRDKRHRFCDVAVIGGGPAGIAAAIRAADSGAEVLLVDEGIALGGSLEYSRFDVDRRESDARLRALRADLERAGNVAVLSGAQCTGYFADHWLAIVEHDQTLTKLRARQVVLACGALEQPIVFRNNDLPGIVLHSGAQRLMAHYGVRPGTRAVVLAGDDHAYGAALDLADAGVEVAAIADLREAPADGLLRCEALRRSLPVVAAARVDEAFADAAGARVAAIRVDGTRYECDLVCIAAASTPEYHLAAQAGGEVRYDAACDTFSVASLPDGLHLAGALNGVEGVDAAIADGTRAGAAAARALGSRSRGPAAAGDPAAQHAVARGEADVTGSSEAARADPPQSPRTDPPEAGRAGPPEAGRADPRQAAHRASTGARWPIFPHPRGKEFVDLDEDLTIADVQNALADGYTHVELLKRFSTLGMGPSQGRLSALAAVRIASAQTGVPAERIGITTARPPVFGEPLATLAGRTFDPQRLTPMHERHVALGAQPMVAGPWLRPAWYGPPDRRETAIEEESLAVRRGVGLIDVSTLGKIEVRGPDAGELLDRLYTLRHASQPVGRIRYALMLNEAGTIVDDGVVARLAEQRFFVTATTTGVDNVLRQMLWWNAQWRLRADISHVTSGFAAVNLAGPGSREVLSRLVDAIDLDPQAFPYLAVREAPVAGIPARLLRIGFVGELGYEIHVPSQMGEALWDALMIAGRDAGIRPVGIEAQRVLRIEKGHIVVGQDTDGMTTPSEVAMDWAIAGDKPFFVGARSLALRARQPARRRLVGFTLPYDATGVRESCLVVDGDEMTGVVTSIARSATLQRVIGLAYVRPANAAPGATLTVRSEDGRDLTATVVELPFYDPKAAAQAR